MSHTVRATDVSLTIQPLDEFGKKVGDPNEVTYPMPEDQGELEELMNYVRTDIYDGLVDYLSMS